MCPSGGLVPHCLPHVGPVGNRPGLGRRSAVARSAARLTRWRLTRIELAFALSPRPTRKFVYYGLGGHEIGHELGSNRMSHAHQRRPVVSYLLR